MPYFGATISKIVGRVAGKVNDDKEQTSNRKSIVLKVGEPANVGKDARNGTIKSKPIGDHKRQEQEKEKRLGSITFTRKSKQTSPVSKDVENGQNTRDGMAPKQPSRAPPATPDDGARPCTSKQALAEDERDRSPDIFLGKGRRSKPRKKNADTGAKTEKSPPSRDVSKSTKAGKEGKETLKVGESRPARSPSGRKNDGKKELPAAKLNDSISEAETEDYTNYNDTNNNDTLNDTHDNTHNNDDENDDQDDFEESRTPSKFKLKKLSVSVARVKPTVSSAVGEYSVQVEYLTRELCTCFSRPNMKLFI